MNPTYSISLVRKISRLLREARYRSETGLAVLEGEKAVADALQRGCICTHVVLSEVANSVEVYGRARQIARVPVSVFAQMSHMRQATGVLGVFEIPVWPVGKWSEADGQVVLIDAIQSPQNLGAIVRNAAAFDVAAMVLLPGSVDPMHPEVLRASSGYALDFPIYRATPEEVSVASKRFQVIVLSARGHEVVGRTPITGPCLWVLGNEGRGVSWTVPHAREMRIPMSAGVESLNVAVASGICFYQYFAL